MCKEFLYFTLSTLCVLSLSHSSALAVSDQAKVTVFYDSQSMVTEGFYGMDPKSNKPGLEVEVLARQSAVQFLQNALETKCAGSLFKLKTNWQSAVKSVRSEVFGNGVFKIVLVSYFKDVFQNYQELKSKSSIKNKSLFLSMGPVDFNKTQCGLLNYTGSSGESSVSVLPMIAKSNGSQTVLAVQVDRDGKLRTSKSEETKLLEEMFIESKDKFTVVPVVVP
jgi:hypothetical protein